jgi:teichuronic acid biosynthesis glycosyltransferase TuaH
MKILYLMHVNWHWIRQRPHVIAELLATKHDVRLMHYAMYRTRHHAAERPPDMTHRVLHRIPGPLLRRVPGLEHLDRRLLALQVHNEARRFKPNCVFVLHPNFEPAVRDLDGVKVVYDCMDDHLAFEGQGTPALASAEQLLVRRADLTLFSSATLAERVCARARPQRAEVLNNGVSEEMVERALVARASVPTINVGAVATSASPTLGYFGTISHWFDWPLMLRLLDELPQAKLKLAGPAETPIPEHPRVQYAGIIPHASLPDFAAECDALVMPFVVNRLIESVDPVKLYEYVSLGLPSFAPRYRETERFEPFVALYGSADEAIARIGAVRIGIPERPGGNAGRAFLASNTWTARGRQLLTALDALR